MAESRDGFTVGDQIRYKPAEKTAGYEQDLEADGRIPGVVKKFTRNRVRVELTLRNRGGEKATRDVSPDSLQTVSTEAAVANA